MSVPLAAERARAAVARARVAALTTYPRHATARPCLTSVAVECGTGGRPIVRVEPGSLAAAHLLALPLASVRVCPPGEDAVTVHGAARRLPGYDPHGRLVFEVKLGAVRLGDGAPVDLDAYRSALTFTGDALDHLRAEHADDLAACLRARGHDALWAEATSLDRTGLTVLAVGIKGVQSVLLAFPTPVDRLEQLPQGLRCLLMCRCSTDR